MSIEDYSVLINELCDIAMISNPAAMVEATNLTVKGVSYSLAPITKGEQSRVALYCEVGALPERRREEVLLRLLDTNFHLFDGFPSPVFSYNAKRERVVLACSYALAGLRAAPLLASMEHFSDMALGWRISHFLEDVKPGLSQNQSNQTSPSLSKSSLHAS